MFPRDPLEEIAYGLGYASAAQLRRLAEPLNSNGYGPYLLQLIHES